MIATCDLSMHTCGLCGKHKRRFRGKVCHDCHLHSLRERGNLKSDQEIQRDQGNFLENEAQRASFPQPVNLEMQQTLKQKEEDLIEKEKSLKQVEEKLMAKEAELNQLEEALKLAEEELKKKEKQVAVREDKVLFKETLYQRPPSSALSNDAKISAVSSSGNNKK